MAEVKKAYYVEKMVFTGGYVPQIWHCYEKPSSSTVAGVRHVVRNVQELEGDQHTWSLDTLQELFNPQTDTEEAPK